MQKRTCVLIPGDGIGPEISEAVVAVLEAVDSGIEWVRCTAGIAALDAGEDRVLPERTTRALRDAGVGLKGPCTTPVGGGFASVNVALRKQLDLYAAVRPVRNLHGVKSRYRDVDMVIIRENTEGLYSGIENEITAGVVTSLKVATADACRRIAQFALDYARTRNRRKVTALHKANIMKLSDGLFLECAREVFRGSEIEYDERIIDAACMQLVIDPTRFDVLLCENLYGDIVSDLCAGLVGGLGVVPGANIGKDCAVFEAVHGSAPDIAGRGVANPLAMLMSSVMLLNHLSEREGDAHFRSCGDRIRRAYDGALGDGAATRDVGGSLGTQEFAHAIIERL